MTRGPRQLRFVVTPSVARAARFLPVFLPPAGALQDRVSHSSRQTQPALAAQVRQQMPLQRVQDAWTMPAMQKAPADMARREGARGRQSSPGYAGRQHEDDPIEYLASIDAYATCNLDVATCNTRSRQERPTRSHNAPVTSDFGVGRLLEVCRHRLAVSPAGQPAQASSIFNAL
jgi:hypothetical protein